MTDGRIDVDIDGIRAIDHLAQRLRLIGDRELMTRLRRSIRQDAGVIADRVREAALALPAERYERGLRQEVSAAVDLRTRLTPGRASVRVRVARSKMPQSKRGLPYRMDRGQWRHPVFGDRGDWVTQRTRPGFFSGTTEIFAPRVRRNIHRVVADIADETEGLL